MKGRVLPAQSNPVWTGIGRIFYLTKSWSAFTLFYKGFKISTPYCQNLLPTFLQEEIMKEIDDLKFPDNVRYSPDHEWAREDGDLLSVGISDFAQDQLGDVVFVELPEVGAVFDRGQEFGTVESVKAVSELFMPLGGRVVEVNAMLEEGPERVNDDPYGQGWMIKIKADNPGDYDALMDRGAYLTHVRG
jgi:glycine cleavage system H protein